ncbi:MAG: 50S ribosomal protein L23 [Elusimicrobiota bacterium]
MTVDPYKIIRGPVVTEKSTAERMKWNKYSIYVDVNANKNEIREAVQEAFKVTVEKVNTTKIKGKPKRMGRYEGTTPLRKKAVLTLKEGDRIALMEGP